VTAAERRVLEPLVIRDKLAGMTWPQIETRHGVKERTGRNWLDRYFAARETAERPAAERLIEEAFAAIEQKIGELAVLAAETRHDNVKLGALKAAADLQAQRLVLLMRTNRLPRQLAAVTAEQALQEMWREFARLAEEFDLPDAYLRALLSLSERRLAG
jgi:hypothetical protein